MVPRLDLVPQFLVQVCLGLGLGLSLLRVARFRESLAGNLSLLAVVALWGLLTAPFVAIGSGFLSMLAWSWTLALVLPALATVTALLPKRRPPQRIGMAFVALLGAALSWYALAYGPHQLETSHHAVSSDRVQRPLRIAVLADLQTDAPGRDVENAFTATMAAKPDVILIAGDVIQLEDPVAYRSAWGELGRLAAATELGAPLGIFMVQGDADWPGTWEAEARALGWRVLEPGDASAQLRGDVRLLGLALQSSSTPHRIDREGDPFQIVLGHRPDFAMGEVDADLLLAGHTHGGQVRVPGFGPLLTFSNVPRDWAAGRTELDSGAPLIVSRGIGMERGQAPRIRFLCNPELVIVDVVPPATRPH